MRSVIAAIVLLGVPSEARAQLPRVRPIGGVEAVSPDSFSAAAQVRPLADGRVIVNDPVAMRVVMLDARLATDFTLFDATTRRPLTYPRGSTRLVAARGDTTFLVDPDARGFRVINPAGVVVRRQSIINATDAFLMGARFAGTSLDPMGRVVFAEALRPDNLRSYPIQSAGLGIIRVGFEKPARDTLDTIRSPEVFLVGSVRGSYAVTVYGGATTVWSMTPSLATPPTPPVSILDAGDDWAMTSEGAIAIVRVADYHVDWIDPDGTRRRTPPVPWPWKVLSADEKRPLVDSLKFHGLPTDVPDSLPPFARLQTRADLSGRIWVREGASIVAGPVSNAIYHVIDRTGQVVDRVELPEGRMLAGFGPKGVVYMLAVKGRMSTIERAVLRPR